MSDDQVIAARLLSGGTVVSGKKLKGEVWFPTDPRSAKEKLDELTQDEHSGACLSRSWQLAIEVVRISMRLVGEPEQWPTPLPLPPLLASDLDDPAIVRHLLGENIPPAEQSVYADFITRMFLLVRERRVPDTVPRTAFFAASVALYLYELCRIALGAAELKPEIWALSELAYGIEPGVPQTVEEWHQQRDTWRKRKSGDNHLPLSKVRHDVEVALSTVRASSQRN